MALGVVATMFVMFAAATVAHLASLAGTGTETTTRVVEAKWLMGEVGTLLLLAAALVYGRRFVWRHVKTVAFVAGFALVTMMRVPMLVQSRVANILGVERANELAGHIVTSIRLLEFVVIAVAVIACYVGFVRRPTAVTEG
jgi:hypothetical protein